MAIATPAQQAQIANLYVALFNRAPDAAGLSFWSNAVANGASISTVTQGFLSAPESATIYPQGQSAADFIGKFYQTVFGRAVDTGGLAFWTSALEASGGAASLAARAQLVSQIVNIVNTPLTAAELASAANIATGLDRAVFANRVEYGLYRASLTTDSVSTSLGSISADKASVDLQKAAAGLYDTKLATAVSSGAALVAGATNDVIKVTNTQLATTGFSIDGGAGTDTLLLTTVGNLDASVKNVSNVENVNIYTGASAPALVNIDATKFVGALSISAASANNVTVFNLAAGQSGGVIGIDLATGARIPVNGVSSFFYADGITSGAVKLAGSTAAGSFVVGGTNLASVALTSTGYGNAISGIVLGNAVNAVTIDAQNALTINQGFGLVGGKSGLAVTVKGPGLVDLGSVTNSNLLSLNAAASTGGVISNFRGNGTDVSTLVGSSVNDSIRLQGNFAAGSTIDLGTGDDNLRGGGVTFAAGMVVDGGAGTDLMSAYLVTAANASLFKNFERVNLSGDGSSLTVDVSGLVNSAIEGVNVNGGTGGVTANNVLATQSLAIRAISTGLTTVNVKDAATNTADSYSIGFSNAIAASAAPITAGRIGLAGVETVNIGSGGAVGNTNQLTLEDMALKALVLTGNRALNVSLGATTATSSIDGSAATASLGIDTTNVAAAATGLTIKGGTAADTLTIAQAATVTGGTGADKFIVTSQVLAAADAADIVAKLVTITDFGKGDSIDLLSASAGGSAVSVGTLFNAAAAGSLLAAANLALAGGTVASIKAFAFGGDTYLVADATGLGSLGAGDVMVKLTGTIDLSTVSVNAVTGDVVFA